MPRVVLILPKTTYRAPEFLDAAESLRLDVVVAGEEDEAVAAELGADYITIDPELPEWSADRIAEYAADHPVDAVVPADDGGVVIAALAGEALGLPHNPGKAAAATRNKGTMRDLFADAGVAQPDYRPLDGDDVAAAAADVGFPCVVKPVGESASRGVIRADDSAAAAAAAARIRAMLCDPDAELLVEEFLEGAEVAVEGMLGEGELEVLAIFDKPDPLDGPYFEETMLVTPSRLPAATQADIVALTARAAAAVGLREGPIHAELRLTGDGPRMLEIAARSIGGLCGRSLRFSMLGMPLETILLRGALGHRASAPQPLSPASGVMMLPIPGRGTLRRVEGVEDALAVPGIIDLEITIPRGHEVVPLPEGDRYLGFLFARGGSPHDVEEALRRGFDLLDVVIG